MASFDFFLASFTAARAAASSFSALESSSADTVARLVLLLFSASVQPSHLSASIAFYLKSAVALITAEAVTDLVASADSRSLVVLSLTFVASRASLSALSLAVLASTTAF